VDRGFPGWIASGTVLHYINSIVPWFDAALVRILTTLFVCLAAFAGMLGLYFMHSIYRIKARPFWNHWQVLTSFYGTMFSLGALLVGLVGVPLMLMTGNDAYGLLHGLTGFIASGLALEIIGHVFHARYLRHAESEAAASYFLLTTQYGKTYIARNILLGMCLIAVLILSGLQPSAGWRGLVLWIVLAGTMLLTALASRALFYVIVIPTTMPGAFFWKNKGFEEHARKTGLAKLPQVGVLQTDH
jgi:DMSO reductase anchor subunit